MSNEEQIREEYVTFCGGIGIFQDEETWRIWCHQQQRIDKLENKLLVLRERRLDTQCEQ